VISNRLSQAGAAARDKGWSGEANGNGFDECRIDISRRHQQAAQMHRRVVCLRLAVKNAIFCLIIPAMAAGEA